jgi:hypothetical protein
MFSESSSSVILHWGRVNKVFGKRSSRQLACFLKFFTTAHLPLRQTHAEVHHIQHEICQADRHLRAIVVVKGPQVTYGSSSQIMSYIFNMIICADMILLDNLLQYLIFITVINLSITCDSIATLIYTTLVMFMIYF